MIVGYARTSTAGQVAGLEAQERELRAAGCDKIFREQMSSVAERQQLEAALDYVREGDSFTITKLDRLARSVGDLLAIVARLEAKKVSLRVLSMSGTQSLDTSTATGRLMLAVIGAVGQAEREAMLERQREGIAKAKREGRYKGRVPTARRQAAEIIRLKDAGVTPSGIAVKLGIGRASVYRVLGEQTVGDGWLREQTVSACSRRRRHAMIGSAIERGSLICAYDEHGMTLFSKAKGSGPNDGLLGFSGSTVTVRFGSIIYTYDEKGMTLYAKAA